MKRIHDVRSQWALAAPRWIALAAVALAACALALPARAEDDLPGRVGRVADFAGQLLLAPQDRADEWAPIGVNYPITSGDNLWVSGDGRAEIDYGGGQLRVAGDTNLHVSRLDDRQLTLFIAQGRLVVRVRVLDAGDAARVDTPNTQVVLTRTGLYRIDVAPDRQGTTVSVREGEALVTLTSGAQQMLAGQMATVTGPAPAYADVRNGFGLDGFDAWSDGRDRRYEQSGTAAYVSRQMVGYAELDDYGTWETSPTYGPVWYPTAVAADWAPYRYGYWTSVGGWGLTWVDSAPWGYAPSHYGRWVRVGHRWGWCPGAHVARPYWAPALVAWYGGGSWGIAGSAGAPIYGWVPLGWGDPYHPGWRGCSQNCWARYNRPYAVDVTVRPSAPPARYSLANVPGAMTAVAAPTLTSRRPVRSNMVTVPMSLATSAPVLATPPAVPAGPSHGSGVRPGERGTPPPASTVDSRTWGGRNAAVPGAGMPASPPTPAPGAAPRTGAGLAGAPSTFTPSAPPAAQSVAPATPGGLSSMPSPAVPRSPQGTAPAPESRRGYPPSASTPESRRGAPAAPTPGAGGTVVAVPPSRPEGTTQAPHPRGSGLSGTAIPSSPPTTAPTPTRTPSPPAGAAAGAAPRAGSLGTSGSPLPPPRSVQPSAAPVHSAPAQPVPTRPTPTPSLGQPAPAPSAAPPARAPAAPAKPAEAQGGSLGSVPAPK